MDKRRKEDIFQGNHALLPFNSVDNFFNRDLHAFEASINPSFCVGQLSLYSLNALSSSKKFERLDDSLNCLDFITVFQLSSRLRKSMDDE